MRISALGLPGRKENRRWRVDEEKEEEDSSSSSEEKEKEEGKV